MLWLAIVCLVGVLVGANEHGESLRKIRFRSQHLLLEHLEEELDKYEHQFAELPELHDHNLDGLEARIDHLDGDHCEKYYYYCGHGSQKCINEHLFCDGHVDCPNGGDEEEELCHADVVSPGHSFHGLATWHNCLSFKPGEVIISFISRKPATKFGAAIEVEVSVSNKKATRLAHGYYYIAAKELDLTIEGVQNLHLFCEFIDHKEADCTVYKGGSKLECATLHVHKSD